MAVTRADKEQELQELNSAFRAATTAILVDYRGLDVPAVTELRRQLRAANAQYRVVKNTLAIRASKGTSFESLDQHFKGIDRRGLHRARRRRAGQDADRVHEGRADAVHQGGGGAGAGHQAGGVSELASLPGSPSCTPSCCSCCRRRCSSSCLCWRQRRGI